MAWLRLDDQFLRHPKIAPLSDADLRVLLATMLYVASFKATRDTGIIPEVALKQVPGLTPNRVRKYIDMGLWETTPDGLANIHDWHTYNPKDPGNADRQRRYRNEHRNADRNDNVTDENRYENVTRTQARARGPSRPSGTTSQKRTDPGLATPPQSPNGADAPAPSADAAEGGKTGEFDRAQAFVERMHELWDMPGELRAELTAMRTVVTDDKEGSDFSRRFDLTEDQVDELVALAQLLQAERAEEPA